MRNLALLVVVAVFVFCQQVVQLFELSNIVSPILKDNQTSAVGTTAMLLVKIPSNDTVRSNDAVPPNETISSDDSVPSNLPTGGEQLLMHSAPLAAPYNAYWCGWDGDVTAEILKLVFDDALNVNSAASPESLFLTRRVLRNHTSDDVAFVTFEGPCVVPHPHRARKLPKKFKGRILYWNGEPSPVYNLNVRDRVYALSHEPGDGDRRRMRVHYGVAFMASLPYDVQRTLYYPEYRVENTGERFLIYANSNCVP